MKLKVLTLATVTAIGVFLPSVVHALQWVKVGIADDQASQVYVDRDSVRRKGNMVKFWVYYVFRQPSANGMSALKGMEEANCATGDYRILREVVYVGGQVQSDLKGSTKFAAAPGTLAHVTIQSVCRR